MPNPREARIGRSWVEDLGAGAPYPVLEWVGPWAPSVRGRAPRKFQFPCADGEVARVDDLGRDVDAVLDLEGNQVGLAVFDFIESRLLACGAPDIRKTVVVIDGRDKERVAGRLRLEGVIELERGCVACAEAVDLFRHLGLGCVDLVGGLGAQRVE